MIYLKYPNVEPNFYGKKIAGFDLDYNLIKPKSGKKFPQDSNDWCWLYPEVKQNLLKLGQDDSFIIVIFTNQQGIEKGKTTIDELDEKFQQIQLDLNIQLIFLVSDKDDSYRKPRIGSWKLLQKKGAIKEGSFYVGDAAGRIKDNNFPKDHSDSDRKFADNIGITFYTPEVYFLFNKDTTMERKWKYTGYILDFKNENRKKYKKFKFNDSLNMILISGLPGSGKSRLAKKLSNKYDYLYLSQDKDKSKLKSKLEKALEENKNVIIEGLLYSKEQRDKYIKLAKKYNYHKYLIHLETNMDLSYHLNHYRSLKDNVKLVPKVVYHTYNKYYEQAKIEDYNNIYYYHPKIKKRVNKYFLY